MPETALPVSIDRVRKVLSGPPAIDPEGAPVFTVEVLGRKSSFEDLLGNEPWKGSARSTPGGAVMPCREAISIIAMVAE